MSGNVRQCVRQGDWLETEQLKLPWMLVHLERLVCTGLQDQTLGQGLGFLAGGGGRRPLLGQTGGCSSQRGRRRAEAQQQRAETVWGKRRMEGWSDNHR